MSLDGRIPTAALYLERKPMKRGEYRQNVIEPQIKLLQDRGVWAKPAR